LPHIDPTWQWAAVTALLLLLVSGGLHLRGRARAGAALREAGLVAGLYTAWAVIGTVTHREVGGAHANALALWHAEQALHLPSELALQQAVTPHPWLVQLFNGYYLYGHFNPVIALLLWVWWRHRASYPRVRLLLCLLTASAFVVHFVPVAPPRLMPELGFHDVALQYGQSVYGSFGEGIPGQLLAMPSLHVGWAILLAYVVVTTSRSRWRWLVVAHPVLMSVDVAVTANHWWADGVACGGLLVLCLAAERAARLVPWPGLRPVRSRPVAVTAGLTCGPSPLADLHVP
jgi:hypothetical protein